MTILAVCGPVGSDYKAFSEQCYSLLNKKNTTLIDSSAYNSIHSLLSAIESEQGDVIVFGPDIFLDKKLRDEFDVKVFLELDSDLCLSNYLKSSISSDTFDLVKQLENYENQIKPLNEKIRVSSTFAALRRPQTSANDVLIDLLIDKEEQTLKQYKTPSAFLPRDMFWQPASLSVLKQTNDKVETRNQMFI
ncbi:uridine kinase [Legionella parisiensis]|nr:uridine kinase [Legionella parisiensis]